MVCPLRRGIAFSITVCIILFTFLSAAWAQEEAPVSSTPEEAIGSFVAALCENDLQKALQVCAIEDYAAGYDFVGMVDYMKTFMPLQQMAPSEYGLYAGINAISAMYALTNQIKMMIYSFFVPEVGDGKPMYVGGSMDDAKAFATTVDPAKLKNLKLVRTDPPMQTLLNSEKNVKAFQRWADIYGADEMTERIALYELDGKTYLGGFVLLRYGEEWRIKSLNSNLAGLSVMGTVEETTPAAYASLL